MRFIEIDLDGHTVRAALNDETAPKTSEAIWNALPFSGTAVHAQISGQMFRMLEPAPVAELEIENREYFQFPGEVVFYPPIREVALCVGEARFSAPHGFLPCTRLAAIEGDFEGFAARGDRLSETGEGHITFREAADQTTDFRGPQVVGRGAVLEVDDVSVGVVITHSGVGAALADPVTLQAVNSRWGGAITHLSGFDGALNDALGEASREGGTSFHWPGYLYADPLTGGMAVCYGDACENDNGVPRPLVAIGRVTANLGGFAAIARRQMKEGEKKLVLRS